jgi:hypothetical protein
MKSFLTVLLFVLSAACFAQPGKYAGTKKSLIGKSFTDSRVIPGLSGWTQKEGALLNGIHDPEFLFADVYKKGTTYLVVFSVKEDTASEKTVIMDVLEVTGVQKGWTIRIGSCELNDQPDSYIIVWGKENQDAYMKLFKKAWRISPDKRRINSMPVKGIRCENIGC